MNLRACWLAAALLWASTGWAQSHPGVIETGTARIDVLGSPFAQGQLGVAARQSRLVIYSLDGMALQGATSVFVNGTYHASLVPGAYSELCHAPGSVELGARQMQVGQRPKDLPDTITAMDLQGGRTHFLRVRDLSGRPVLQPVPAQQALQELPGKRLQQHTISRVAQECVLAPAAPEPETARPVRHTLSADRLFVFARADRDGITGLGTYTLDQFIARLRADYSSIERLHVVGHADPLGDSAINERLAIERANTVRQYIESVGQLRVPISAEGRGSREPVVTDCPRMDTPSARACNLPNRRVVIEVTGTRR